VSMAVMRMMMMLAAKSDKQRRVCSKCGGEISMQIDDTRQSHYHFKAFCLRCEQVDAESHHAALIFDYMEGKGPDNGLYIE